MALASDAAAANAGAAIDALVGPEASANKDKKDKKPPADAKKQVFAGNLAFSTSEDDLRALFSQAGPVADIQIITRGSRSLGYCFITYESEESAQKAVATLNKQVVAGREINLEGAKPQEELAALKEAKAAQRREKNAKKKEEKETAAAAAAPADAAEDGGAKKEKKKRAKKPRSTAGRRPRADEGEEADKDPAADGADEVAATNGEAGADGAGSPATKKKTKKTKAQKAAADAVANGEAAPVEGADGATATSATEKKPRERKPRVAKGPPTGEPSSTLLFAANLSFEIEDEQLKEAFTSEGLQVVSATVVKRKFGLKKSKGFGFVDFADKAEQTKALEKCNGKSVGGRDMSLKIAIQGSKEEADAEAKEEAEAATTTQAPSAAI